MKKGIFISFEGGEGAGKSTQIRALAQRLEAEGFDVVLTREPGGSEGGEAIRDLLVNGAADRWSSMTETLLMYAARRDHLERVIWPALERGSIVLCDRFSDSTRAYQGAGGGVPGELIADLENHVLAGKLPDLTLVFDLPAQAGLQRAEARGGAARFESKGLAFHERLRAGFIKIAELEPQRCAVIDATATVEAVSSHIWNVVSSRLEL